MKRRWIAALILGLAVGAAACGSEVAASTTGMMSGGMDTMAMGDATLTRADVVAGADLASGVFQRLESAPVGYDAVAGRAWLARHGAGTTVTIDLTGLLPNSPHIAHVHAGACAEAGGPHFQFDPGGSTMPPNQIHLMLTSDSDGHGFMTVASARVATRAARSVVVHPVNAMDAKVACAELG
ncbi:MAG: superoxide dismutase family protein [Acidimicrobiia bacterium]|nr:superoxide dismutase family protein [Acidimicrobiia bacterium]NNF11431.1 superoxide dismutase family protein [Acidimicrobiia bacterium]NNL69136.1 superoxide dismutase family protein [Acidimicrobiia bacterium]